MTYVEQLVELIPPPAKAKSFDWQRVEESLGVILPDDYKELVETYSGGQFEDYLYFLEPDREHYDIMKHDLERAEAYESLWEYERKPDEIEDGKHRLIPWATTDNGEYLFWLVRKGEERNPDNWPVMINAAKEDEWEYFPMGCVAFFVQALERKVISQILSYAFPLTKHKFQQFIVQ
ncbi:SMI1/KNR4 family protein [Shimazuella sp. AN120528]|uniref:SMI1/KNR4 family protein n=1 Tax=Shimazuella soli TaxID=1892854 RepID=UPI001F10A3B1|nr:SMI1/KNR4 family protein [Shimazuella soli]MCH5584750.1 SMI1/KNR4 family protein [Shimazuella soli]